MIASMTIQLMQFQSTRPVRGATDCRREILQFADISIHAPRAGRDQAAARKELVQSEFQSTRPVRGATTMEDLPEYVCKDFNPRAPCGARLLLAS